MRQNLNFPNKPLKLPSCEDGRYTFKKNTQFIWMNVLIAFQPEVIGGLLEQGFIKNNYKDLNIAQVFIISAFLLLPVLFLHYCIGHISQLGSIAIGRMAPVATGIHFSMLISTYFETIKSLLLLRDSMHYALLSFNMPWMQCPKKSTICVGIEQLHSLSNETESFEALWGRPFKITFLSSYQYYMNLATETTGIFVIRISTFILISVMLYLIASVNICKSVSIYCRTICLMSIFLVILLVYLLSKDGSFSGINQLFAPVFTVDSYTDLSMWTAAMAAVLIMSNSTTVAFVVLGSYLHPKADNELLTLETWITLLSYQFFLNLTYASLRGSVSNRLKVPVTQLYVSYNQALFVVYTLELGLVKTGPGLITCTFFSLISFLVAIRASAFIQFIYQSMCEINEKLSMYKQYIILCSVCLTTLSIAPIITEGISFQFRAGIYRGLLWSTFGILLIGSVSVFWIYGVHNLCDDYHFKLGYQPSHFWKIAWWSTPVILTGTLYLIVMKQEALEDPVVIHIFIAVVSITFTPQIIALILRIFHHIKNRDINRLFLKEDTWGDPDSEVRAARRMFPPRQQLRYRRRSDVCKHNCLRYNPALPIILHKEAHARMSFRNLSVLGSVPASILESGSDISNDEI